MPHVKGLSILNDCEENHKLAEIAWMVSAQNQIVVEELDQSSDYPSFRHFSEFVQKEARIACNPVASPLILKQQKT